MKKNWRSCAFNLRLVNHDMNKWNFIQSTKRPIWMCRLVLPRVSISRQSSLGVSCLISLPSQSHHRVHLEDPGSTLWSSPADEALCLSPLSVTDWPASDRRRRPVTHSPPHNPRHTVPVTLCYLLQIYKYIRALTTVCRNIFFIVFFFSSNSMKLCTS